MSKMPEITSAEADSDTLIRRGPSPLPVHMGLAMVQYMMLRDKGVASKDDLQQMLRGIKKYQQHSYSRDKSKVSEIYKSGEVSIKYYPAKNAAASILLIPSLINKSYIFDLLPEVSFASFLAQENIDVYLLDWGVPCRDAQLKDIDSLIVERLVPAIKHAADCALNKTKKKTHVLGYCMGGTFLPAAAKFTNELAESLIFLAAPWDFSADTHSLASHVKAGSFSANQIIEKEGHLPKDWVQTVFAAVNAERAMDKFIAFANLDDDSPDAKLFVAVEDWLNDGVDLPDGLARCCLDDWYGKNLPSQGLWTVNNQSVDLSDINIRSLIVASKKDRLVPGASSLALAKGIKNHKIISPSCGHIGMMTGKAAKEEVWQPILSWLSKG